MLLQLHLKTRPGGRVRAKRLSALLREEEERMGFIMAGITLLTLFTGGGWIARMEIVGILGQLPF